MEDPNLIATLLPREDNEVTRVAFGLPHNLRWCLQPTTRIVSNPTISSRDTTPPPSVSQPPTNLPSFQLTFSKEPKVPREGYSFGTNPQADVLLGEKDGNHSISHRHFCITFDHRRRLILRDSSRWGTAVSYGVTGKAEVRKNFIWILDLYKDDSEISKVVAVHIDKLKFNILLPNHAGCQSEYDDNVDVFRGKDRANLLALNELGIDSIKKTPFAGGTLSCDQGLICIDSKSPGSGSFGDVKKVLDVSTGDPYARKTFRRHQQEAPADRLRRIKNEIKIMMEYKHVSFSQPLTKLELITWKEHIVPLLHHTLEPEPSILMPYYSLGSLSDQHKDICFSRKETIDILLQILKALAYLHQRNVAHRDLKPDNVLVESRVPSIKIRVADFGLAKIEEETELRSSCGTKRYMAPEIVKAGNYKPSVDLWAAGVMILEFAYNFQDQRAETENWCQHICNYANDRVRGSDPLIEILKTGMLKMDPEKSLSAGNYVRRIETDLLNNHILDTGVITQTRKTAKRDQIADTNDATTAIPGVLRVQRASNFGGNGSSRRVSKSPIQKTDLQDEVTNSNGLTTNVTGVIRDQETSNPEDNGSPGRFSERQLQKTDLQDEVADSNGPITTIARAHQGQETSNFEVNARPGRVLQEEGGMSNAKLEECPITTDGQGYNRKRPKPAGSSSDRESKRQRKTRQSSSPVEKP